MLFIKKEGVSQLFIDTTKVSKEEISMVICDRREMVGTVMICTTYHKRAA